MPAYTDFDRVMAHLPKDPPASVTAKTDQDIADASAQLDARVGAHFPLAYGGGTQRFPDITETPATPAIIELTTRYLAVHMQYVRMKEKRSGDGTLADKFGELADKLIGEIIKGDIVVTIDGAEAAASALAGIEDPIYEDLEENIFNPKELDLHSHG